MPDFIQNSIHTERINDSLLDYLYKVSSEGIMIIVNGKISFVNKYFLKLSGHLQEDLLGQTIESIIPEYAHQIVYNIFDNILDEKEIQYIPILKSNKEEIHLSTTCKKTYKDGVKQIFLTLSIPDIENYLISNIDIDLYHSILNSVSENILIISNDFNIIQSIKVKTDRLNNIKNLSQVFSSPAIKQLQKVFEKKWKGDEPKIFELQNYKSYYESRLVKFKEGLFVFSFSEISLKKRIEHKLIDSQIQLGQLNKEKDLLLSIIAHDLKNPFNIINGFCSVLLKTGQNFSKEKKEEITKHIYTASMSGYNLLENLLEWSRSQSDRVLFKPQEINLKEISDHIITFYSMNIINKQIIIENKIPKHTMIMADKNMISTILRNLISNAIKFTSEKGIISIAIDEQENEFVCIKIADNGIGMSEKQISNLFQIGKNYSTQGTEGEKGTGLGLLLCKEFIEKHKGIIAVTSTKNLGTEFRFTLPVPS